MSSTLAHGHPVERKTVAPLLRLSGVGKRFGDGTVALAGIDLTVAPGEFVSVVGPSGCGKSTLLSVAAGLSEATEGSASRSTDQLGYVFQSPALLPWRTVRANVELLGELHGLPADERRRRADEAVKLVGLEEFASHRPGSLSGGMRMRASLARSLTMRPELFLFDEPFGALDEITRQRLGDELLDLFVADRFAALFVTHSLAEAVFLSSRILVLSGRPGRVLGEFSVPFGYPRPPESRFAEEFTSVTRRIAVCLREGSE